MVGVAKKKGKKVKGKRVLKQKHSFCASKGHLSLLKSIPFTLQKVPF